MREQNTSIPSFKLKAAACFTFLSIRISRKLLCLALILSLLIFPGSTFPLQPLSAFAASTIKMSVDSVNYVAVAVKWLFASTPASKKKETLADRVTFISRIRITPVKLIAYEGEAIAFNALATDGLNRTIQGVAFGWESSNPDKLLIDNTGRATLLQPGLAEVTCRAGAVTSTARVLIRPGKRPYQTDEQWQADQSSLSSTVGERLPSLIEKLSPKAYAQSGLGADTYAFTELATDPGNLVGSPRNRIAEATRAGLVLPESSNFQLAIPLVTLSGRGLGINLTMYYNSQVWGRQGNTVTFSPTDAWPSPGFSLGFGRVVNYDLVYSGPTLVSAKYMLIDPDGTRHYLGQGGPGETTDGYHIKYFCSWGITQIRYNDGTLISFERINNRLLPNWIQDRNGNYITIAYKNAGGHYDENGQSYTYSPYAIDYITDTLGRKIEFNYSNTAGIRQLVSITAPGLEGTAQNPVTRTVVQFDFQNCAVSNSFSGLTVRNAYSFSGLRRIFFPATATGYTFNYSAYGMIYTYSIRRQMGDGISVPLSDGVETAAVSFNYPTVASSLTELPSFSQRTETAVNAPTSVYTYGRWYYPNEVHVVVDNPDSTQTFWGRFTDTAGVGKGLLSFAKVRLDDWATERQSTVFSYASDLGGSPQVQAITNTVTNDDATSTQTKIDFDYDQYGNVTNKREYGFQTNGVWQVQRRTNFVYKSDAAYINANLRSLVTETGIYDAQNTVIAKAAFTYDDYQAMGGMEEYTGQPSPPGHTQIGASTTIRGNVTGTMQWVDISTNTTITRLARYDKFGNVVKAQVSCCQEKVLTYTQDTHWSQPNQVTSNGVTISLTDSSDHDFNTNLVMSQTDPRNQTVTYGYNAALAPTSATLPTGAESLTGYNYGQLSSSNSTSYEDDGVQKTLTSSTHYDGWGREIKTVDTNGAQVNTTYDAMGRVSSKTNPFAQGSQPGPATTYQYDALGQITISTLPDGNTVRNEYSGSSATAIDQVNRKIRREMDGLGRLVKVVEQDPNGLLTRETTYSYNLLDQLIQVNQGGQIRSYKYDTLDRLLYEKIPEQTATINEAGGLWTTKYTYTNFNQVETRRDARGAITTYSYDTLHRLTQVSYGNLQQSGVAATANVTYVYDNNDTSPSRGLLLHVMTGTLQESYNYDEFKRIVSVTRTIDSRSYTTRYQYNNGSQIKQLTYPSGAQHPFTYNSKGRLSSAPYVSSISYDSIGRVQAILLGNGVVESYGYDPQRMQLISQTATKGAVTLMSLSYGYQAQSGQHGSGTTAGNSDRVMTTSGTVNGQTESSSFTYDLQGRLATSNQLIVGTTSQRRFTYDLWGNRTGVWDALNGGNQIQSVAIAQSGGVTNNRIATVGGIGYSYDAAGNLISDGVHTYQYDAESRLVSVDNGATAQYSYDHQNRRVKKIASGVVIHCVWEGNQVIAEHNASTGAQIVRYAYLGSRMVAKVAGATTRYLLSDRLSVRMTLNESGAVVGSQAHGPWGEATGTGEIDKHLFTNYEKDYETNTDYAVNRQYAGSIGRFMRVDPYAGSYDVTNPQSLNRYSYVANDPVNAVDPTGLVTTQGGNCAASFTLVLFANAHGKISSIAVFNLVISCRVGVGPVVPGITEGGQGGRDRRVVPLPGNLRARLDKMLRKNNNECGNFVQSLINKVAQNTGQPLYSDDVLTLFDVISGPQGGGFLFEPIVISGRPAGGTIRGSMGNIDVPETNPPTVIISPVTLPSWAPVNPNDNYVANGYTQTALHEIIHLAAARGTYGDRELAEAVVSLGGMSQAEIDEFNRIGPNDIWANSAFWDKFLKRHCH